MSKVQEKQPPYRQIFYNRTGNLATQTQLDREQADQFMRVTDMRREVVVVDSDKPAKGSSVKVGDDVLAFRVIEPIGKLSAEIFKPHRYHKLARDHERVEIQVHEQQIDADVRAGHFIDRSDYNAQFLKGVNQAVKDGLSAALFHEKLGFKDQARSLLPYAFLMGPNLVQNIEALMGNGEAPDPLRTVGAFFMTNLFAQISIRLALLRHRAYTGEDLGIDIKRFPQARGDWKEALLPVIPVDRYFRGAVYLARHGNDLVVPRQ